MPRSKLPDTNEISDYWRAVRAASQVKRGDNRAIAPDKLTQSGIRFTSKNDGAHLIVYAGNVAVDFWPGTGLWIVRGGNNRRRGIRKLIRFCNQGESNETNVQRPCKSNNPG